MEETKKQPERKFRGGGVSVAVFRNESKGGGPYWKATVLASYTDQEGNWHDTHSLTETQLAVLSNLTMDAARYIRERREESRSEPQLVNV